MYIFKNEMHASNIYDVLFQDIFIYFFQESEMSNCEATIHF